MAAGNLLRELPMIDVADDKPAQHEEQVDGQVAFIHSSGEAIGVNRRKVPAIVEQDDPQGGNAAQRRQRSEVLGR